jgi:DNA repair protein RadD
MDEDRSVKIKEFKDGKYRAMVNVNILTTGFNVPDIDLIAMLRPTQSPVLHVQAVGRGLRVAPGKSHCLILDFAGNTMRLGPINNIQIKEKRKGTGEPVSKECKECGTINPAAVKECLVCGSEFQIKDRKAKEIHHTAAAIDILRRENQVAEWIPVSQIIYSIHQKKGSPSSLRVQYRSGLNTFSEWVCIEHHGYAKAKAMSWVRHRWNSDSLYPNTLSELYSSTQLLKKPVEILINIGEKYPEIRGTRF